MAFMAFMAFMALRRYCVFYLIMNNLSRDVMHRVSTFNRELLYETTTKASTTDFQMFLSQRGGSRTVLFPLPLG
jgi:hypothetical protein